MKLLILLGVTTAVLFACIRATIATTRLYRAGALSGISFWVLFVAGLVMGLPAVTMSYPVDENTLILGFPLPAAGFERHGEAWLDFVSPFTIPFLVANFIFWLTLPHAACFLWRRVRRSTSS